MPLLAMLPAFLGHPPVWKPRPGRRCFYVSRQVDENNYFFRCFPCRSSCAAFADASKALPCPDRETRVSLICSFLFRSPYFPNRPLLAIPTPKNLSKKVKR